MKPLKMQNKAINSTARCTFLGLSAGGGKTATLLEISKRFLQKENIKILFPLDIRHINSANLKEFYANLGCKVNLSKLRVESPSGSRLYFIHQECMSYDITLLDNADNLNETTFNNYVGVSAKSFVALNVPENNKTSDHWFIKYLNPFMIKGIPSRSRAGDKELLNFLEYTVVPFNVFENPYIDDNYKDCLFNLTENHRDRLLLGYYK